MFWGCFVFNGREGGGGGEGGEDMQSLVLRVEK